MNLKKSLATNVEEETYDALKETYPHAGSDANIVRMAINDALTLRECKCQKD